jgi:predicted metal-dependent hydrolase
VHDEIPLRVEVVRSRRRKRSTAAQMIGETLRIHLPSWMSADEERHWVDEWTRRFRRKMSADRIDLGQRATALARRYDLPRPASIRWVDMETRWGSCTPAAGTVRISSAVARFPAWVLDYVIVHELAHLVYADHSPAFWWVVNRYPRTERARGYLIAKSGMPDDDGPGAAADIEGD